MKPPVAGFTFSFSAANLFRREQPRVEQFYPTSLYIVSFLEKHLRSVKNVTPKINTEANIIPSLCSYFVVNHHVSASLDFDKFFLFGLGMKHSFFIYVEKLNTGSSTIFFLLSNIFCSAKTVCWRLKCSPLLN